MYALLSSASRRSLMLRVLWRSNGVAQRYPAYWRQQIFHTRTGLGICAWLLAIWNLTKQFRRKNCFRWQPGISPSSSVAKVVAENRHCGKSSSQLCDCTEATFSFRGHLIADSTVSDVLAIKNRYGCIKPIVNFVRDLILQKKCYNF